MGVEFPLDEIKGALGMTEKQFQAQVVKIAQLNKWLVYHTYDSRRSEPGFPDLVMVGKGAVIFAELKVGINTLTSVQIEWGDALLQAGANWFVWYPEQMQEITEILQSGDVVLHKQVSVREPQLTPVQKVRAARRKEIMDKAAHAMNRLSQ